MKKKTIAILQSNYIPWKGYFDLINMVDEFILYDDMQYTRRDWRNRNKVIIGDSVQWLTIPVKAKGKFFQKISEVKVNDHEWAKNHWRTLVGYYSKSDHFKEYRDIFEDLYLNNHEEYLSKINYKFILAINEILGITTKIRWSNEFELVDGKTERLLGICKDCNATEYISGPAAKGYFDEQMSAREGIKVRWMDYSNYPEYNQLGSTFEHGVTVLDLIFNEGNNAMEYMKSFAENL